jgi:SAM-dependent methyltransferase
VSAADPPVFEHRDPVTAAFWTERYQRSFTPWDHGGIPAALTSALARGEVPAPGARVLVPGCGTGHELAALAADHYDWLAVDLAPLAVEQARRLQPTSAERIRVADFFLISPVDSGDVDGFDWIYERAFLCALPPTRWRDVVDHAAQLLKPGGVWAGLFFVDDVAAGAERRRGPPFAIAAAEQAERMSGRFDCVSDRAVAASESLPAFSGRERWQVWKRRGLGDC